MGRGPCAILSPRGSLIQRGASQERGPNTPHLVVQARVLKQADTTERSKGETNELE